jgi:hypothetical protein
MALNKYSHQSDAIVNLYRASLYLARGSEEVGLEFLRKAKNRLGKKLDQEIISFIATPEVYLKNSQGRLFWAEKILDEYQKLRRV